MIVIEGRRVNLGRFVDPVAAARAYNNAAREAFGEAAVLNEIPEDGASLHPDRADGAVGR